MKRMLAICENDLRCSFAGPLAYAVISGFMLMAGFFFFSLVQQFNLVLRQSAMSPDSSVSLNEWVIFPYYQTLMIVLVFLLPVLTMRSFAEEKQRGTFELLATSPLTVTDMVIGKYLGVSVVAFLMVLCSFLFPLLLIGFAELEVVPVVVGFFGLLLFTLSFCALGLIVSASVSGQATAGVITLILFIVFYVVDAPVSALPGGWGDLLRYLAPANHASPIFKGLVQGRDIVYFCSLISLGLFFTNRSLEAQRWR